ncbi:hypothetical protein FAI40_08640 [Acetobacteraceae bacterium]|nr:hypothetical protein FAI40_08640 [Acetobacteraceae bacterium]
MNIDPFDLNVIIAEEQEENPVPDCFKELHPQEAWVYNKSGTPWTHFDNLYAKTGRQLTALHLEHLLYQLWTGSLLCPDKSPQWPRWAACSFGGNQDRTEASALKSRLLVYDVDQGQSLQRVEGVLSRYSYVLHTTHSHSKETPSFRVILQADKPCKLTKEKYKGIAKALCLKVDLNACNLSHVYLFPPESAIYKANRGDLIPVSQIVSQPKESQRLRQWRTDKAKERNSYSDDDFVLWTIRNQLPNRYEGEGQTKWIPLFRCIAENYGQDEAIRWAEGSWKNGKERLQDIKSLSHSRPGNKIGKGSIVFHAYPSEEDKKQAYRDFQSL